MKKSVKILSAFLALIMVLSVMPVSVFADTYGDWEYYQDDAGRYYIAGYNGTDTAPVVPGVINGCVISGIGDNAFSGRDDIESITLPARLIYIGYYAFEDCSSLVSIDIPEGVGEIRDLAFDGCTSLESINVDENNNYFTSVGGVLFDIDMAELIHYPAAKFSTSYTVPDGVCKIKKHAFSGSSNLTRINLPDSLYEIEDGAFLNCTELTSVTVPEDVMTIGVEAFAGCSSLYRVTLPDDLAKLSTSLFSGCYDLAEINMPKYLRSIDNFVFAWNHSITSITIPNTVNEIAPDAFSNFVSLEEIEVDNSNTDYASDDGILFNADRTALLRFPCGKTDESYTVPSTCREIGESAFQACNTLRKLTIPRTVTSLGDTVFDGCDALLIVTCYCGSAAANYCSNNGVSTSLIHTYENGICKYCSDWQKKNNAVSLVSITNVSSGIQIKWNALPGADGYIVYYDSDVNSTSRHWARAAVINDGSATSYVDTQRAGGKSYRYTVKAFRESQNSKYSTAGLTIYHIKMPTAKLENTLTGVVHISWSGVAGAAGYYVYRKAPGASSWTRIATTKGTSWNDKNNDFGSLYTYTVKAYNDNYCSAFNPVSIVRLDAPAIALSNTEFGVQIKWNTTKGAMGYYVYRKVNGGSYSLIGTTSNNAFIDKTSKAGTTYYYAVRAYDGSSRSSFIAKSIMCLGMTEVTPKNVSGGIQLSWSKTAYAKGYYIYRKTGSNAYVRIASTTSLSYIDTNVKPGYSYTYAVRAYNGSYLGYFEGAHIVRLATPSLKLSTSTKAITLSYGKITGAKGYEIYRKVGSGSYTKIATVTTLSYSDKNVKNGTKYTYAVRAYNGTSYSSYAVKSVTKK